jgi:Fic/DOC family
MARIFQDHPPPVPARPAGYAWLIENYDLSVPVPRRMAGIGDSHARIDSEGWLILSPRYEPAAALGPQVTFALKNEGVNLSVLKALEKVATDEELSAAIKSFRAGKYMRRFWFLMEWLGGRTFEVPDASPKRGLEQALDPKLQFGLTGGEVSERHRIINNLPGTVGFCPLVRRTKVLQAAVDRDLSEHARRVAGKTHPDLLARASAFLLLSDSKASFQIENERPSPDRTRRWAQAMARAGSEQLTVPVLLALQKVIIGDARFVTLGLREEGGFVGSRDRISGAPLPEHVSAVAEDVPGLMAGLVAFMARVKEFGMDPVAATAALSFGFVYVHPFVDGNGRLHRWLIHHALEATGFTPEGLVFPVSRVMLRRIGDYRRVLESYSRPLLEIVRWKATPEGNVEVLNETGDFYRFFDATAQAEFLYDCVAETVDKDLPEEVDYLEAFDRFSERVQGIVDMPTGTIDQLRGFLDQNAGSLSSRARGKEFSALSPAEIEMIQEIYAQTLGVLRA